jgi:predicted ATPase
VVRERAEGNPLYAEEFMAMLGERYRDGEPVAEETEASGEVQISFPESIHAIIAARLDTLSPEQKLLLQNASVVGKVFWSGAISLVSDLDEPVVREVLHELTRKELVRPARASSVKDQAEYSWRIQVVGATASVSREDSWTRRGGFADACPSDGRAAATGAAAEGPGPVVT